MLNFKNIYYILYNSLKFNNYLIMKKINDRVDDILDKISKYGIKSLTKLEKEFLDSFSKGKEKELNEKLNIEESRIVFEDIYFKFEFDRIKEVKDGIHFIGTFYVPDLNLKEGVLEKGILKGKIISFDNGLNLPKFKSIDRKLDIVEFCDGLEYELDVFIDYIVMELKSNNL